MSCKKQSKCSKLLKEAFFKRHKILKVETISVQKIYKDIVQIKVGLGILTLTSGSEYFSPKKYKEN